MFDDMLSCRRPSFAADAEALVMADVALLAKGLLACLDAPLLTIERCADRLLPVMVWDDRLAPCRRRTATLYTSALLSPALAALHGAAAPPLGAGRRAFRGCLITDGIGVALIKGDPVSDVGWRIHAARATTSIVVLPFPANSVWTLLRTDADML